MHRQELNSRPLPLILLILTAYGQQTGATIMPDTPTSTAPMTAAARDALVMAGGADVADEQLAHILPVMSEHINLLGRYEFNPTAAAVQTEISALPLRSMDLIIEQLGLGI